MTALPAADAVLCAGGVRDGLTALPAADGVPGEGSHVARSS